MHPDSPSRDTVQQLAKLVMVVPAVALAAWLELLAADRAPGLNLTPLSLVVALSVWYGGFVSGAFALLLSAFAIDFFLFAPRSLFDFGGLAQTLTFALYSAGWLLFCALADRTYRRTRADREARVRAERTAEQADRQAQLTAALGQVRTPGAAIEASVQESLHALGAETAMLLLISADGKTAELARGVGYRPEELDAWQEVSLSDKTPVADAVGRGAPVIVESRSRWSAEYAAAPPLLYASDRRATVAVPLVIGSRVVAVIRLDFRAPRTFPGDDREYLFALGLRGAQALDRTWQYEAAQRARIEAETLRARADQELAERQEIEQALRASEGRYRALAARTSRLHGLTAALSEAVTLNAVAQAVVHQGKIAVGATTGDVTLLVEGNTQFETLYAEGDLPGRPGSRRFAADSGLCATDVVQSGQPVFIGSFAEWQERYWRSASIAADGGYVSSATLPLNVEGQPIGVLAFHFTAPVNFDEGYRALLVSVAQHCAQALDRARLYESAQRARAEAEAANRLKDEFVSIVSHELRTPLNAMLGWTSMLQKGSLDPSVSARALRSIHDNATRQARLIDELLDFSRIIAGRTALDLQDIDIRDLIRGLVESMIPTAAASALDLELAPVPPVTVRGDRRRLEQVFFNLLGNAVKFTPAGGRIGIDVRIAGSNVEVRVVDSGRGIDPAFLPYAFDRFRQADSATTRNHGGLGLGLSIARQLVEAHRGAIAVESAGLGCGSTFTVKLPIAAVHVECEDLPVDDAAPREDLHPPRLEGVRILVVDDEPDTRDIMTHALQSCGADVMPAASAPEALEILDTVEIDVLLADIAMPGEDGYTLIRKIRASAKQQIATIPAAAVTAHARDEERQQALAAGFHLHLAKPFEPAQLARMVETLLRGSSMVH